MPIEKRLGTGPRSLSSGRSRRAGARLASVLGAGLAITAAFGTGQDFRVRAQEPGTERIRGQITAVDQSSIDIDTRDGVKLHIGVPEGIGVFRLSKGSFTDVDFGVYVGSVAVRLNEYSPIVRDSLSWLHEGFELRVIDEKLRGIAVGVSNWDVAPDSIMTHGWVDDLETRVLSIKYGPTEEEETDVQISRDTPVLMMSLGDRALIKAGANVMVGAQKDAQGNLVASFVFVGEDGIVPPL